MTSENFAGLSASEVWLSHFACVSWLDDDRWTRYLASAEEILGADITHLDQNDPVRRRVSPAQLPGIAKYVTSIGKREDSRWVFGRIASIGVDFSIRHYREPRGWPNSATWYFPQDFFQNAANIEAICRLFDQGNHSLNPFYAYADAKDLVCRKKKESGAVDIQAELLGVFWLSYFGPQYVSFLGKEAIAGQPEVRATFNDGVTLRLGETPSSVPSGLRENMEVRLGRETFVEPNDSQRKRPGQYALTFEQLKKPA